ncbi:SGNH/GDSL hydrolase family protein [uncultured Nitrospira sp.]|uniref:SGNH/GDSL hydrolase family protein n=1 Tax=uncultured Nitrospira sp. TaxID=157176 RepID=UPI00313FF920
MPKRWKRTLLYAGYLLLVTLPLLEMGVRIWGYAERHIYDPIYRSFEPSKDIPYIHKPNLLHARARGLAVINTDSLGLRATTSGMVYGTKPPHEYRIAIVGDSVTFGEGIPGTEDTYAQVLEDTLNRQQQAVAVKVFNFGASAYSVKQMAAMVQSRMVDIQPDLVVMAIIPQDFNLSRTPIIDAAGYLVDQRIGILLDSPVREVLRGVHLLYVLREIALPWFSSSQDISSLLSYGEIPDSYRYVQRFKETADQYGLPSLIMLLPRMEENAWGSLSDRLSKDAIKYLDLSSLSKEFTKEEYMASRFDSHASPAVHHRIGEAFAEYVQKGPMENPRRVGHK